MRILLHAVCPAGRAGQADRRPSLPERQAEEGEDREREDAAEHQREDCYLVGAPGPMARRRPVPVIVPLLTHPPSMTGPAGGASGRGAAPRGVMFLGREKVETSG